MCLILFAIQAHPRYPLIVAANRDESFTRPASPAGFWTDHPDVYAGRDLEKGGTWLGIARNGRFAAITNYRQSPSTHAVPRSRGELTRDYLTGNMDAGRYLDEVSRRHTEYHGFSLIVGTPEALFVGSNRGHDGATPIEPGVHGLSNRLLDEPWPKVLRGVATLRGLLGADEAELRATLFELLADHTPTNDHLLPSNASARERERLTFILGESYGTRASTLVLVREDGEVLFVERSFGPGARPIGTTEARFALEPGLSRGAAVTQEA